MVGCWRGGETWWGISERGTPSEIGIGDRSNQSMRICFRPLFEDIEKVSAKLANLRNGVLRNVAEVLISIRRTKNFLQKSGDFGEEIF
jgi:hypothetical protein